MVIFAAVMSGGCATAASRGELAVDIETPVPMAYISLVHPRSSEQAEIGNIPDGTSAHVEKLRPGLWCITGYVDASGDFARVYQLQSPTCDYVDEAGHAELRLVRERDALLVRSDGGVRPGHLPQGPHVRSPAEVEQIVAPARAQLDACIADAQLPAGQSMAIHAVVDGPTGRVSKAQVLPPHHVGTFTDCLTDVVDSLVFPAAPEGDQDLVFAFP